MNPETYQKRLIGLLEGSVANFNTQLPAVESSLFTLVINLLKELQVDAKGKIINNTSNLSKLARIKVQLEKSVLSDKWVNSVKGLLRAFKSVEALQNEYYATLDPEFRQTTLLRTITSGAIDATLQSLTESGIQSQVISKVNDVLKQNIISQASYSSLVESMQLYLKSTADKMGLLSRYASQFVTDALNQYSASYTQTVAQDLGFKWFMYTGSLLTTSRPWCEHMVKKKYIHESEFPEVLKGHFDDADVELNEKTKLPQGMMPDTTVENLPIKRGGYNCGHQLTPVHESVVPDNIKKRLETAKPFVLQKPLRELGRLNHLNEFPPITIVSQSDLESLAKLKYELGVIINLAGGIPKGVEYSYSITNNHNTVIVKSSNNDFKVNRVIDFNDKSIYNSFMEVYVANEKTGLKLLINQILQAKELGFKKLLVTAGQSPTMNGYMTWGKYGYTMKRYDQEDFDRLMQIHKRPENNLFELLSTKEGEGFWNKHGWQWSGEFDLSDESINIKNLKTYMARKGYGDPF